MIPALSAAIFVILFRPPTLFTILLTVALVFCMLGDVGMEVDLTPGIGMFLIGHIFFAANFLWKSSLIGLATGPMTLSIVSMSVMVVYVFLMIRYLKSSGPEVPPFILRAGILYFFIVSATVSTSLLLWQISGVVPGYLPVLGALVFIVSDSIIGINAFYHEISHHELYIMSTYYIAIFLLSLSVFAYAF